MDFPSEDWVYNDLDEFDTAPTNMKGDYTLELYAQLRPTGRILNHFRAVLRGICNAAYEAAANNVFMKMLDELPSVTIIVTLNYRA